MKYRYYAFVEKDSLDSIPRRISIPELNWVETKCQSQLNLRKINNIKKFTTQKLKTYLNDDNFKEPQSTENLLNLPRGEYDRWIPIDIEFEPKKGCFAKLFTRMGKSFFFSSAFLFIINACLISEVFGSSVIKIGNNFFRFIFNLLIGIAQAILNIIVYYISPSNPFLLEQGTKLDNYLNGKSNTNQQFNNDDKLTLTSSDSTKIILLKCGLGFLSLFDILYNTYSQYVMLNGLELQIEGIENKTNIIEFIISHDLLKIDRDILTFLTFMNTVIYLGSYCSQLLTMYKSSLEQELKDEDNAIGIVIEMPQKSSETSSLLSHTKTKDYQSAGSLPRNRNAGFVHPDQESSPPADSRRARYR